MLSRISTSRQSSRVSAALSLLAVLSDGSNWLLWGLKKFEKVKPAVVAMIDRNLAQVREEILDAIKNILILWQTRASGLFSNATLNAATVLIRRCAKDKVLYLEKILTIASDFVQTAAMHCANMTVGKDCSAARMAHMFCAIREVRSGSGSMWGPYRTQIL